MAIDPILEDLFKRFGITPGTTSARSGSTSNLPKYLPNQHFSGEGDLGGLSLPTSRLQGQIDRQRGKTESLGQPTETSSPNTLMRVLDILSRPNYAMAEGARQVVKQDKRRQEEGRRGGFLGRMLDTEIPGIGIKLGDTDDFVQGAWQGLQGREKTNFNRTLQEAGMEKSPLSAVAGFVGDVALDPLSYLTLGTGAVAKGALTQGTKGLSRRTIQEAAEGYGIGAARELLEDPSNVKHLDSMARNQLNKEILKGVKEGGTKVKQPTAAQLRKTVDKKFADDLMNVIEAQKEEFLRQNQRSWQPKFAGKNLLPESTGRSVYEAASTITSPLSDSKIAQAFRKNFDPKAKTGLLHGSHRMHEGRGVAAFEESINEFRHQTAGLHRKDAVDISHALEEGYVLDGELGEIQSSVRNLMDNFFEIEKSRGLHKDTGYAENYVPHFYNKDGVEIKDINYRGGNINKKLTAEHNRAYKTIKEAEAAGAKPIKDIRELVARRAAEHSRKMAAMDFLEEAAQKYGINLKYTNAAGKTKSYRGGKNLMKNLENAGVKLEKIKLDHMDAEFYVPKEVAGVIRSLNETLYDPAAVGYITKQFDKIQQAMKAGFTVLVPGHHMRNLVGDIFLNFEDGVVNPKRYAEAAKISAARMSKPGSTIRNVVDNQTVKIGNRHYSLWEINQAYNQAGLSSGYMDIELARKGTRTMKHPLEAARGVATAREDTARIAHFIDALKKEAPKTIREGDKYRELKRISQAAAERVNKFNLDYGDLTDFEKKYMRRFFLFYTFMRKNLPLQLEMMFTRPGKIQMASDLENLIEGIAGIENDDPKLEASIPQWIKDMGAYQLTDGTNPVFSTIQLPTAELGRIPTGEGGVLGALGDVSTEVLSASNPFIKIPTESVFQQQAFSGAPIGSGAEYGVNQLPFGSFARKMADPEREGDQKIQDVINMLTGLGLQPVTEERRRGELRRQQDILQSVISEIRREKRDENRRD